MRTCDQTVLRAASSPATVEDTMRDTLHRVSETARRICPDLTVIEVRTVRIAVLCIVLLEE